MGRMQHWLDLVRQSRLLAPNLKEMTLHLYTGNAFRGNIIARDIVRDHLLALRWMNPNAIIYLREYKGQGQPRIEYSLWTEPGARNEFEVKADLTAEEAVAKVMMGARDPDIDVPAAGSAAPSSQQATASGSASSAASPPPPPSARPTQPQVRGIHTSAWAGRTDEGQGDRLQTLQAEMR